MKIGLALGSGSARGWAHIGILDVLAEHGIVPDVVAGTSIGAIVGASYASGHLERLRRQVLSITRLKWATFFSPSTSIDGWINHARMREFLVECGISHHASFSDARIPFGCVACDLHTGREKWLTQGPLLDAVWASMALPGLFPAVAHGGHWYIDGGIVNPVPVSLCRALGADFVIAVNLNSDILARNSAGEAESKASARDNALAQALFRVKSEVQDRTRRILPRRSRSRQAAGQEPPEPPSAFETLSQSINIAQDIITRSRLAGDPPDVLLAPKLAQFGLLETYRGQEGIAEGRRCCELMIPMIEDLIAARRQTRY